MLGHSAVLILASIDAFSPTKAEKKLLILLVIDETTINTKNTLNRMDTIVEHSHYPIVKIFGHDIVPFKIEKPNKPTRKLFIGLNLSILNLNYTSAINNYNRELDDYDEYQNIISNFELLQQFRNRHLYTSIMQSTKPTLITSSDYQNGYTDNIFFKSLKEVFPEHIKKNKGIEHKHSNFRGIPYMPDLIYEDFERNIFIDIEIDEPYTKSFIDGKHRKPHENIHFIGCGDDNRDWFFLEQGWIVVRFAEEQIVKNRANCIKLIEGLVNFLNNVIDKGGDYKKSFEIDIPNDFKIKKWTLQESNKMANSKYRDSYLIGSKISNKNHEIEIFTIKDIREVSFDANLNRPYKDKTILYCVEFSGSIGDIKYFFDVDAFVIKEDFTKNGIYFGQKVPAGYSFKSTDGYSENYMVNDKTEKRVIQNQSLVNYKGKEQLMTDEKIDALGDACAMVRESKQRELNRIFSEFAIDCGITAETSFELKELIGSKIGIKLHHSNKNEIGYEIESFFSPRTR